MKNLKSGDKDVVVKIDIKKIHDIYFTNYIKYNNIYSLPITHYEYKDFIDEIKLYYDKTISLNTIVEQIPHVNKYNKSLEVNIVHTMVDIINKHYKHNIIDNDIKILQLFNTIRYCKGYGTNELRETIKTQSEVFRKISNKFLQFEYEYTDLSIVAKNGTTNLDTFEFNVPKNVEDLSLLELMKETLTQLVKFYTEK